MDRRTVIVFAMLIVVLMASAVLNVHYYVNVRPSNENLVSTFRARALFIYGLEAGSVSENLEQYLQTSDSNAYDQAEYSIYRALIVSDILSPEQNEKPGNMYYELKQAANAVYSYVSFSGPPYTPNSTKLGVIAQAMNEIYEVLMSESFDSMENKDPLTVLSSSDIDSLVNYCQQIQNTLST